MGFAVPAAIGAKVGRPDRMVWAVDGDGCFQMTAQELVTASAERIPVKIAILNNAYLGMVRQWQEMFYDERYSEVYLSPDLPDYMKWAEAMGCVGDPGRVARGDPAHDRQGQRDRRPTGGHRVPHRLVARRCSRWCAAGASNSDVIRCRPFQARAGATMSDDMSRDLDAPHPVGARREQGRRAGPGGRTCSPAAATTSTPWLSRRPTTSGSAASVVVDVESAPLEQIVKQLHKLINVVKITELDPAAVRRARAAAGHRQGRPGARGQVIELVQIFGGTDPRRRATTSSPCRSRVIRPRWTTSRSFCDPTGSWSCSERAGWPFPSWSVRHPRLRSVRGKVS